MAKQLTREEAAAVCREYAGRPVAGVEVYPDPAVDGTYAIRAEFAGGEPKHFLLAGWPLPTTADAAANLEEVELSCWPPAKGGRNG